MQRMWHRPATGNLFLQFLLLICSRLSGLDIQNNEVVGSFSTMRVLVRTTFTRKITHKQDLKQQVTI